jgi:hypothetical protein
VDSNTPILLWHAHGIRNELQEEFAKSKEMCLLIRKEKNVTSNQEA